MGAYAFDAVDSGVFGDTLASGSWARPAASAAGEIGGMAIAAGVLVILGLAGATLWRTDLTELFGSDTDEATAGADTDATGATTEPVKPADTGAQEGPVAEGEDTATATGEPTDAKLIVDILESNDGRMRQAAIVEDTGWSKSKVSMVLSDMEDDGEISKLRVGRENIVSLSGNEPEAAGSPFDDE